MTRLPAAAAMDPHVFTEVFRHPRQAQLQDRVRLLGPAPMTRLDDPHDLDRIAKAQILITGWGAPALTEETLSALPELRYVLHAGGSVRYLLPEQAWERGITVSACADLGAEPVAEFAQAAIQLAVKGAFFLAGRYAEAQRWPRRERRTSYGADDAVVGVVGASRIGRRVLAGLHAQGLRTLLYDPYVSTAEATLLGTTAVELGDLVAASDVVSLHAPSTAETRHLIGAAELNRMRPGATLINTARGALVDHDALVQVCRQRRIAAVLDVTDPEPLPAGHRLFSLPGVLITPHLSGLHGSEVSRMGSFIVDQLDAVYAGRPLAGIVDPALRSISA